ncbi:hypothetical protein, partial [Burkholderia ambifaria]|uniref:hypothetical protein n=1 Tax=Burkholderia ambifaria TaxID=152480 RepID=UPI000558335A
ESVARAHARVAAAVRARRRGACVARACRDDRTSIARRRNVGGTPASIMNACPGGWFAGLDIATAHHPAASRNRPGIGSSVSSATRR